jgi:Ca2+-binding EF-hand superfamily protein
MQLELPTRPSNLWTTLGRFAGPILAPVLAAVVVAGCQSVSSPFAGSNSREVLFISAAQTWDLNRDNVVTCDEWKQYLATSFAEVDANNDGNLTPEEFANLSKQDKLFEEADYAFFGGKDGKLTLAQMQAKPNPAFERLDKNKDCRLVSDEMVRMHSVEKSNEIDWEKRQEQLKRK